MALQKLIEIKRLRVVSIILKQGKKTMFRIDRIRCTSIFLLTPRDQRWLICSKSAFSTACVPDYPSSLRFAAEASISEMITFNSLTDHMRRQRVPICATAVFACFFTRMGFEGRAQRVLSNVLSLRPFSWCLQPSVFDLVSI